MINVLEILASGKESKMRNDAIAGGFSRRYQTTKTNYFPMDMRLNLDIWIGITIRLSMYVGETKVETMKSVQYANLTQCLAHCSKKAPKI